MLSPGPRIAYSRHVTNALPKISPLVLTRRTQAFDNPDWLFELKYDGFRALLEIDGAGGRLVSRNLNRFRHLRSSRDNSITQQSGARTVGHSC